MDEAVLAQTAIRFVVPRPRHFGQSVVEKQRDESIKDRKRSIEAMII